MSDYDGTILACIESEFKESKQIAEETGISQTRVDVRLAALHRAKEVIWMPVMRDNWQGRRPKKYRKSCCF